MSNSAIDILNEGLTKLKDDIIARHKEAGQFVTGASAAAFEVRITGADSGELLGPIYAGVFERGRKPGKVPYDFKKVIMDWASAKGLTFQDRKQFERWASAVAWKIRREGTSMYRSGKSIDIFETPIHDFEVYLGDNLPESYAIEIINLIFE
jgi:hypothetical protein